LKYKETIILPVVLYGCETWSVTLREEYKLRVFGNRVLRRIFGPKNEEVLGGWIRLHSEQLHNLYSSLNIYYSGQIKEDVRVGHVACAGEVKNM
jgi:hypothetical protein